MYRSINLETLNTCDIILTTSTAFESRAIRFGTKSDISHAMICVAYGSVIDSTGEGVHSRNVQRLFYDESCSIYIMRSKRRLSENEKSKIITYIRSSIGTPYGVREALKSITKPNSSGSDLQFCSRLAARAFAEVGIFISENPDFCTPAQIKESPHLFEVPNAFITLTSEDRKIIDSTETTLDDMRAITNELIKMTRDAAPKANILSINDIIPVLLKDNSLDECFATAFKKSGYLEHWKKDINKHMYRYDIRLMKKYISNDPNSLLDLIDYCRRTLDDEIAGCFDHWKQMQSYYRDISTRFELQTVNLNLQLYNNLVKYHEKRIETAKVFLECQEKIQSNKRDF